MQSREAEELSPASRLADRLPLSLCSENQDVSGTPSKTPPRSATSSLARDTAFPPTPTSVTDLKSFLWEKSDCNYTKRKRSDSHNGSDDEDVNLARQSRRRRIADSMASALEPLHETLDETVEKLEERMTGSLSGFNNELLKAGEECTEKHKRQSQKLEALETRVEKAEQGLNIEASPQDVIRRIKNIDERITDITTRQTTVDILGQDNAKLLRRTITRDDAHMLLDPVREDIKNTKDTMRTTRVVFDLRLKAVEDAKETVKATQTEFDHRLNAVEDAKETMRATQTEFDERLNAEGQNRENLRCDLTLKMGTHRIETDSKITKRFDEFEGKNIVPLRTDITKLQSTTKLHDEKILELSKDRLRRAAETPTLESVNELQVSHNGLSDNVAKVKADVLQVDGKVTALQESFDKHALQVSSHHNQLERLEEAILKKVDPPSETAKSPAHSSPTQTSSTQSSCNHTREQKIYWSYEAGKRNVEHLKCHQKKIQKIKAKTEVQREIIDGWDERIMKVQADLEKKYDERIKEMKEQHDVEKAAMSARLDGALATMQSMASDIRALKDDQQPMPAMVTDLRRQIEQEVEVRQHKTELLDSRVDEVSGVALAIRDVLFPELRQELEDRVQTVLTTTQQDSQHNIDTGKQALEDLRTEVKGQIDEVTSRSSLAEASLESRIEKRADAIEEKTTGVLDVLGQRVTDLEGATKAAEMVAEASSATLAAVKERMTDLESASEASKAAIEALSAAFDLLNGLVADLESATKAAPSAFAAKLAKTEQFKSLQNEVDTLTSNRETNDTDLRNIRRRLERIEANPQPVLGEYVTSAQFNGLQSWCRTQFSGTKADLKKDMKQRVHSIEQDVERVKKEVEQTKQEVEQVKHQVDNDASAYTTLVNKFPQLANPATTAAYPSPRTSLSPLMASNPQQQSALAASNSVPARKAKAPSNLKQSPQQSSPQIQQQYPQQLQQQNDPRFQQQSPQQAQEQILQEYQQPTLQRSNPRLSQQFQQQNVQHVQQQNHQEYQQQLQFQQFQQSSRRSQQQSPQQSAQQTAQLQSPTTSQHTFPRSSFSDPPLDTFSVPGRFTLSSSQSLSAPQLHAPTTQDLTAAQIQATARYMGPNLHNP